MSTPLSPQGVRRNVAAIALLVVAALGAGVTAVVMAVAPSTSGPQEAWTITGFTHAKPWAVDDQRLLIGDAHADGVELVMVDKATGDTQWSRDLAAALDGRAGNGDYDLAFHHASSTVVTVIQGDASEGLPARTVALDADSGEVVSTRQLDGAVDLYLVDDAVVLHQYSRDLEVADGAGGRVMRVEPRALDTVLWELPFRGERVSAWPGEVWPAELRPLAGQLVVQLDADSTTVVDLETGGDVEWIEARISPAHSYYGGDGHIVEFHRAAGGAEVMAYTADGQPAWEPDVDLQWPHWQQLEAGGFLVATDPDGSDSMKYRVDLATGGTMWDAPVDIDRRAWPYMGDDYIVSVGAQEGVVELFDARSGSLMFSTDAEHFDRWQHSDYYFDHHSMYMLFNDTSGSAETPSRARAFNLADGSLRWSASVDLGDAVHYLDGAVVTVSEDASAISRLE